MSMQRIANYGSFLQAYALKQLIEELGHKVEFVDYHVGAPAIAENADSKNKFVRKLEKGLETFRYQAPLSHKISFIQYKQSFAKKYMPLLGITDEMNYNPTLDCLVICKMDENGNLTEVVETKNIVKTADGAEVDGVTVDVNSLVSMNMWGLTPDFLTTLEEGFKEFFKKEVPGNPLKAEYLIPIFIGELLSEGKMSVKVLKTNDTWYGMTYHEDVAAVKDSFHKMLENGVYKADLFSDLL